MATGACRTSRRCSTTRRSWLSPISRRAQIAGDPFYGVVADDTLAYVAREMTDEAGGFFSAEDADSIPVEQVGEQGAHKSEGAFYALAFERARRARRRCVRGTRAVRD